MGILKFFLKKTRIFTNMSQFDDLFYEKMIKTPLQFQMLLPERF